MIDNITKLRETELELLEAFIKVCMEHHLQWFAMFGTLLGAMRYEGFLPWDDDIDVVMPLADYQTLCTHKEWFDDRFFLQTPFDEGLPCIAKLRKNGTTAFGWSLLECLKRGGHHGIPLDIIPLAEIPGTDCYHTPTLLNESKNSISYPKFWFLPGATMKFEHLNVTVPAMPRKILSAVYGDWGWPTGAEVCRPCFWFFDVERGYEAYFKRYTGMLEEISNKKIYLFGAADSLRIWLERFGLREQVVCTFDNDRRKWGNTFFGVEVRSPQELPGLIDSNSRIIITSLWHQEIGRQLEKLGIDEYYVFLDYHYTYDKDGNVIFREEQDGIKKV
ncbi:LicD family protein [Christensenellaceae bacterium OttesenSCG-928-M15]|nr:LicD family protein [Christensenellaceae bacterium OttesenSCG-928-M15]